MIVAIHPLAPVILAKAGTRYSPLIEAKPLWAQAAVALRVRSQPSAPPPVCHVAADGGSRDEENDEEDQHSDGAEDGSERVPEPDLRDQDCDEHN